MSNKKISEKGLKVYTSRPWELTKTCFLVVTWIILVCYILIIILKNKNCLGSSFGNHWSNIKYFSFTN
jgi:hypothetical protein